MIYDLMNETLYNDDCYSAVPVPMCMCVERSQRNSIWVNRTANGSRHGQGQQQNRERAAVVAGHRLQRGRPAPRNTAQVDQQPATHQTRQKSWHACLSGFGSSLACRLQVQVKPTSSFLVSIAAVPVRRHIDSDAK